MVHRLRLPFLAVVLLLWLPRLLPAQILDPAFHLPDIYRNAGAVDAIQQADGKWVVLGTYQRVENQPYQVNVVRYNTDGTLDQTFVQNAGSLKGATKVQQLPNGQLLLLNGKWQQGAVQRTYLVRLNADGTLDAGLNMAVPPTQYAGYTATFTAMAVQADGKMVLTAHNASALAPADRVMRLLPDGTRDASFSVGTGPDESVKALAIQADGKIIIGGDFIFMNGTRVFGLVRLLTNGSLDASFQPPILMPGGYLNDLALEASGNLLVACSQGSQMAPMSSTLFRLNSAGAAVPLPSLAAPYTNRGCQQVRPLPSGQIMAVFYAYRDSATTFAYAYDTQLVRLQASGATDATLQLGNGADGTIGSVFCQANGQVLLTGSFNNFNGQRRSGVALLQSTGALSPGLAPLLHVQGLVNKMVRQPDGKLVLMGQFDSVEGQLTDGVARLLPSGQLDTSFSWRYPRGTTWNWQALAVQPDGRMLVAGTPFARTGAGPLLHRMLANGTPDASFSAAVQGSGVSFLQVQADGRIVVGGGITDQAGKVGLTRLLSTGPVDAGFVPPANEAYPLLLQADGKLMCQVRQAAPATGLDLMRLLPSGAPDPGFSLSGPIASSPIAGQTSMGLMAQQPSGDYVIASFFGSIAITPSAAMAQLASTGAQNTAFSSPVQAYHIAFPELGVKALATQADNKILVGGRVKLATQATYDFRALVRLQPNGQVDASFDANFLRHTPLLPYPSPFDSPYVNDIVVEPSGAIVVAGWFDQAGSQPVSGLARLLPAGVLAVRSAQSTVTEVWPVPAQAALNLKLDAAARPQRVALLDALGKEVLAQSVAQTEFTLNTAPLARGIYVLRVDYASGPATQRVVLE